MRCAATISKYSAIFVSRIHRIPVSRRIPYSGIPYPVSQSPVSRGYPSLSPVSRYNPLLGPSSAERRSHARRAPLARSSSSLPARCVSARRRRGRLESSSPISASSPSPPSSGMIGVGGAEWSPKSPRHSPRRRDEDLVALRRGRGARREGWRGCFQALLVELSARSSIQEQLEILFPKSVAIRHHTFGLAARCSIARLSL